MIYLKTFECYTFGREEFVEIINPKTGKSKILRAKIDTETYTTNIDYELASELGLELAGKKRVYNTLGDQLLNTSNVELVFSVGDRTGKKISTDVTISDRKKLRNFIAIGRKDLKKLGYLIDVSKSI